MIKYLGSKRLLVPVLGEIAAAVEARTAVDLFTGTTRVAQEFKRRGLHVTATDLASYSEVLSDCYVATDADAVDRPRWSRSWPGSTRCPGRRGYVTRTFCEESRYFQPHNGARIDAIRDEIDRAHPDGPLRPILLTALLLAADRVDSTTGLQMAYLKQWSPRSHQPLELRLPELLPGPGRTVRGDAMRDRRPARARRPDVPRPAVQPAPLLHQLPRLGDAGALGRAGALRHRLQARRRARRRHPQRLQQQAGDAGRDGRPARPGPGRPAGRLLQRRVVDQRRRMVAALRDAGRESVEVLAFDTKRYVGAQIGIHGPTGVKVGEVGRLRNVEYLFLAGDRDRVAAAPSACNAGSCP